MPGLYTVTLRAGGATAVETVRVEGDPEMPISDAAWRERERFLLDLLATQRAAWHEEQRANTLRDFFVHRRDSLERLDVAPEAPLADAEVRADSAQARARRARTLRTGVYRLASVFNGGGVRQGTLHPPTETHRALKARLDAHLRAVRAALDEMEMWRRE